MKKFFYDHRHFLNRHFKALANGVWMELATCLLLVSIGFVCELRGNPALAVLSFVCAAISAAVGLVLIQMILAALEDRQ